MGCSASRPKPHSLRTLNRCPIIPEPPESFNRRHWKILIVVSQTYEKIVLISLQEAENAVVTYAQEQNRHQALVDGVAESRRSVDMADGLYAKGRVNYLDVLDAQRSLYQSEDQLAASDQAVSLDLIALYKALGGGWETLTRASAKALSTAPSP